MLTSACSASPSVGESDAPVEEDEGFLAISTFAGSTAVEERAARCLRDTGSMRGQGWRRPRSTPGHGRCASALRSARKAREAEYPSFAIHLAAFGILPLAGTSGRDRVPCQSTLPTVSVRGTEQPHSDGLYRPWPITRSTPGRGKRSARWSTRSPPR
ncbi:hypothetical protein FQR65_LT20706 [Abscondita terminalis]|nr:hypothetical protein FQR65_LT20706 [Abscondita terminalis]